MHKTQKFEPQIRSERAKFFPIFRKATPNSAFPTFLPIFNQILAKVGRSTNKYGQIPSFSSYIDEKTLKIGAQCRQTKPMRGQGEMLETAHSSQQIGGQAGGQFRCR